MSAIAPMTQPTGVVRMAAPRLKTAEVRLPRAASSGPARTAPTAMAIPFQPPRNSLTSLKAGRKSSRIQATSCCAPCQTASMLSQRFLPHSSARAFISPSLSMARRVSRIPESLDLIRSNTPDSMINPAILSRKFDSFSHMPSQVSAMRAAPPLKPLSSKAFSISLCICSALSRKAAKRCILPSASWNSTTSYSSTDENFPPMTSFKAMRRPRRAAAISSATSCKLFVVEPAASATHCKAPCCGSMP